MNHFTSIEQSKKLLELGLKAESADMHYGNFCSKGLGYCSQYRAGLTPYIREVEIYEEIKKEYHIDKYDGIVAWEVLPCWSVGALLELMPKMFYIEGKDDLIEVALLLAKDQVIYEYTEYDDNYEVFRSKIGNFIDCLYETVCWLLQNNYIK